ncbi:hypothetical protein CR513_54447, partial [Mucuna pruriens]
MHKVEKNKLMPNWEGPFRVTESVGRGAYRLEHLDGQPIPQTDPGSDSHKLQDPKWTAIETDPRSDLRKLQDPKRTAIETNLRSDLFKLQDLERTAIETDPRSDEEKTAWKAKQNDRNT